MRIHFSQLYLLMVKLDLNGFINNNATKSRPLTNYSILRYLNINRMLSMQDVKSIAVN